MPGQVSFRHVSLSAPREWAHLITDLLTPMCELQMSSQVYWPKHFPTLRAYSEKKIWLDEIKLNFLQIMIDVCVHLQGI